MTRASRKATYSAFVGVSPAGSATYAAFGTVGITPAASLSAVMPPASIAFVTLPSAGVDEPPANGVPSGFHRRAGTSMAAGLCFFLFVFWTMKSWVNAPIRHLLPWRS